MKKLFCLSVLILGNFLQTSYSEESKENTPTYLVSTEANYAPFIYLDDQGVVSGFDVDILSAIAENQGFKIDFLPTNWDNLFNKVTSGETDIIAAAIIATEDRKEIFELSNPYITSHRIAIISNPKFSQFDRIEQLGLLKFATQSGSSNETYLKTLFGEDVKIHGVDTQFQEIQSLFSGEADAAYDDYYVMLPYLRKEKYKKGITKVISDDKVGKDLPFVFAVKKGRFNLLNKINSGLANIKNNGTYQKIYDKYFSLEE